MKKTILLTTLSLLSTFASAETQDFVVSTGGSFVKFTSGEYDYNIYYTGNATARARIGEMNSKYGPAGDYYINSLTFKDTGVTNAKAPVDWNLISNFSTEVKATSGEVVVLANESASNILLQGGDFKVFTNVENSTATAKINLGTGGLKLFGVSSGVQTPRLVLEMNTIINGSLVVSNQGTLLINSGTTTLNNNVDFTTDLTDTGKEAKLNVAEGAKLVANGEVLNIFSKSIATIDGTISGKAGILIYKNGIMTVNGTIDRTNANLRIKDNGQLVVNGTYIGSKTKGIYIENSTGTSGGMAEFKNSTNFYVIENYGNLTQTVGENTWFNAASYFGANSVFTTSAQTLTIKDSTTTIDAGTTTFLIEGDNAKVSLNGGKLILNKQDAIKGSLSSNVSIDTVAASTGNSLEFSKSQNFKNIAASNADLSIALSDGVQLFSEFSATEGNKVIIYNFKEDSIFVSNYKTIDDVNAIFTAYNDSGTNVIKELWITNEGWLTAAIPEPASLAAIFGTLSIALAIIRRRK